MKNIKIYLAVILCLICFTALSAGVTGDKHKEINVTIWEDDYESVWLIGLNKNEKIDISVTVTSPLGGTVDVYILSWDEYLYDYPDEPFNPALSKEGVTSTSFTFKCPDDQNYYLVIDNTDNSRTTDAVPTGDVTVDYEYDDPFMEDVEEALWTAWWFCVGLVIIGVVIILVIIFVIIKVAKKETPPQQYPPQYPQAPPQGYQQYPQQPYQQPYQPPPQQPSQQPPQQPPTGK